VPVDDLRPKAAGCAHRVGGEARVLRTGTSAPSDDRVGELVAPLLKLPREVRDEDAEVGRGGTGIHLGDEEDAHC